MLTALMEWENVCPKAPGSKSGSNSETAAQETRDMVVGEEDLLHKHSLTLQCLHNYDWKSLAGKLQMSYGEFQETQKSH